MYWAWIKSFEELQCNLEQLMTFLPLVLVTFLLFLFLKSDQEHIFGSEHLHYVMCSDSLVTKVNDKFSIYFSCARVKAPEI